MKIETKLLADIKPADYNPRSITQEAMTGLRASIDEFGLVQPIIWNKRTGNIVGGHQRYDVLLAEGVVETQVVVVDLNETREKALNITLNNPLIEGQFTADIKLLVIELKDQELENFDNLMLEDLSGLFQPTVVLPDRTDQKAAPSDDHDDDDELPAVPTDPETQPGSVTTVGVHNVHCGDCLEIMRGMTSGSMDSIVCDPPAGIGFMGKSWDKDKGGRDQWIAWLAEIMREALRVLKPGAHAFVWALPKTSHWTATACEDAGFDIRDVQHHIFGSGFPKSMDVSEAIDRAAGAKRKVLGPKIHGDGKPQHFTTEEAKRASAGKAQSGATVHALATEPATEDAKKWDGFGTAMKPAVEHWILCRKPLSEKTIAANVLKHGTGALNIDACRVGKYNGRFPAHLSHDGSEEVLAGFPQSKRQRGAITGKEPSAKTNNIYGQFAGRSPTQPRGDSGSAARFFYCAKPSRAERDVGCEDLEAVGGGAATDRKEGSAGTKSPRAGAGRTGGARNIHPTVKSTNLMRWLCRLITPPGGHILDPFLGSGTTMLAAEREGFVCTGVEKEPAYCDIAIARINGVVKEDTDGS